MFNIFGNRDDTKIIFNKGKLPEPQPISWLEQWLADVWHVIINLELYIRSILLKPFRYVFQIINNKRLDLQEDFYHWFYDNYFYDIYAFYFNKIHSKILYQVRLLEYKQYVGQRSVLQWFLENTNCDNEHEVREFMYGFIQTFCYFPLRIAIFVIIILYIKTLNKHLILDAMYWSWNYEEMYMIPLGFRLIFFAYSAYIVHFCLVYLSLYLLIDIHVTGVEFKGFYFDRPIFDYVYDTDMGDNKFINTIYSISPFTWNWIYEEIDFFFASKIYFIKSKIRRYFRLFYRLILYFILIPYRLFRFFFVVFIKFFFRCSFVGFRMIYSGEVVLFHILRLTLFIIIRLIKGILVLMQMIFFNFLLFIVKVVTDILGTNKKTIEKIEKKIKFCRMIIVQIILFKPERRFSFHEKLIIWQEYYRYKCQDPERYKLRLLFIWHQRYLMNVPILTKFIYRYLKLYLRVLAKRFFVPFYRFMIDLLEEVKSIYFFYLDTKIFVYNNMYKPVKNVVKSIYNKFTNWMNSATEFYSRDHVSFDEIWSFTVNKEDPFFYYDFKVREEKEEERKRKEEEDKRKEEEERKRKEEEERTRKEEEDKRNEEENNINEEKDNINEEKNNINEEKDNINEEKNNINEEKDNINEEKDKLKEKE